MGGDASRWYLDSSRGESRRHPTVVPGHADSHPDGGFLHPARGCVLHGRQPGCGDSRLPEGCGCEPEQCRDLDETIAHTNLLHRIFDHQRREKSPPARSGGFREQSRGTRTR